MKRRFLKRRFFLATSLLGGCSVLPERPYAARRDWPMQVVRTAILPPPRNGRTLLLRPLSAAPGLEERGLHALQPDGSMAVDFYEQWVAPPALALEQVLRQWLEASGKFTAVLAPGSRLTADFVLEGELTALWVRASNAEAALAITVLDQRGSTTRVRAQSALTATAPLTAIGPAAQVAAQCRALTDICTQVEAVLAPIG